ncbi:porin family protein [Dysgonomonas sp. 511]|uniref:porin family protein n=1 Tax=Dysgonomonas sp. 511 TaxID=2302930 RepID=UPI0013D7BE10|nr:porin family protein [Dysgonomonas sp. 511]NDV78619.1 PorT family protein [Dysgonomonas sp. 511]
MTCKDILILLLFICFFIPVKGQDKGKKFEPEWNVGVGFGPTFSTIDFEKAKGGASLSTKNTQQFAGGLALRYLSEKNLGFIVELNYSQQGWEQDFSKEPEQSQYAHTHKLSYLELPVLTHIYFGRKLRFVFNLGPKLSYLISESEEMNKELSDYLSSGNMGPGFVTHQYYRNADRKIDYGLMGGLGLELRTGIGNFMLEGRYTFGLGDIYSNSKSDYFPRSANRVISAKLTYYIKLF